MKRLSLDVAVSIVVVTRDRPVDLRECLKSLLRQRTPRRVEIIVVDTHPASGLTPPAVAEFPRAILEEEWRRGLSYARNTGIGVSHGDVVVVLDDGVTVPDDWLEELIAPFVSPEVMIVTGNVLPRDSAADAPHFSEQDGRLGPGFAPCEYNGVEFTSYDVSTSPTGHRGATTHMAFRAAAFHHPKIGLFEETLGAGMPTGSHENAFIFNQARRAGYAVVYTPTAVVRHKYTGDMSALRREAYNYSKGHVAYLLLTAVRYRDSRALCQLVGLRPLSHLRRILSVFGPRPRGRRNRYPISLALVEIAGSLVGPGALWRALRRVRREGRSRPYVPVPLREESRVAAASGRSSRRIRKFVIVAQPRTGSTLLHKLLSSHRRVVAYGEIFHPSEQKRRNDASGNHALATLAEDPVAFLHRQIFRDYPGIHAIGFKLFYTHARNKEWNRLWAYLRNSRATIVHLKRQNLLDQYLSFELALRSDVWILSGEKKMSYEPIALDPRQCFRSFQITRWHEQQTDQLFRDNPQINLTYERLKSDPEGQAREVLDFLGLEPEGLSSDTVKQRTQMKSEVIANYSELKKQLIEAVSKGESWADEEWLSFFDQS